MSEGKSYIVHWERTADGYSAWLRQRHDVRATTPELGDLFDALADATCRAYGDGEAQFEFVPPLPTPHEEDVLPQQVCSISGQGQVHASNDPESLYEGGLCTECGSPLGPRTSEPLSLTFVSPDHHGHFDLLYPGRTRFRVAIYSEEFLSLLPPACREGFEWRLAKRRRNARRRFYECIANDFVPWAAPASREPRGWRCTRCGRTSFMFYDGRDDARPMRYIAEEHLPTTRPLLFACGTTADPCLLCDEDLWRTLVGKQGTRGVRRRDIGLIRRSRAILDPRLPTYAEKFGDRAAFR